MTRVVRLSIHCPAVLLGLLILTRTGWTQPVNPPAFASDRAEAPAVAAPPVFIFQEGPLDLDAIRKRLARPDLVILKGPEYERLLRSLAGASGAQAQPPPGVIDSVTVAGTVRDDLATLSIELGISLTVEGPAWLPIRLDGQTVSTVREGEKDRALREARPAGWEIELKGPGPHRVAVGLIVPVKTDTQGMRIDLAIPAAASTRLDLVVPGRVTEAEVGPQQPIQAQPAADSARLQASVSARDRLLVSWRNPREPASGTPPLLSVQGEIAIEVNRGTFQTRSSWSIQCERGQARTLDFRLSDRLEELLGVELDDQPIAPERLREGNNERLSIPLSEPLRPGMKRKLVLTTRRSVPAGVTTRIAFGGFPFEGATVQSGVLALVQGPDLWVSGTVGRGLRQVDPRELPDALRARPSTVLACLFVDQPFSLDLRIDPTPVAVTVEGRSVVTLQPGTALIETDLDYRARRGRIQELRLAVPDAFEVESVGPDELVESFQSLEEEAPTTGGRRTVLVIRLDPREAGSGGFTLHLRGRQPLAASGVVALGLVRPLDVLSRGGQIAVHADRQIGVAWPESTASGPFLAIDPDKVTDKTQEGEGPALAGKSAPLFVLRYEGAPRELPLKVATRELEVRHETRLSARIEQMEVVLDQETRVHSWNGALREIEIAVPAILENRWELVPDEAEKASAQAAVTCEKISGGRGQEARYRLRLGKAANDRPRLRFHARIEPVERLAADRKTRVALPLVRIVTGDSSSAQVAVTAGPFIDLTPIGAGWTVTDGQGSAAAAAARLVWVGPEGTAGGAVLEARAAEPVLLPRVLASRLWIRTVESPDRELHTTASYRIEAHPGRLCVALPSAANWIQARVGGELAKVERQTDPACYRIPIAKGANGPVLVVVEYSVPATAVVGDWQPPRLVDDSVVQQTRWEVLIPWNRALVGVPAGWSDENHWYWDRYVWKRRPVRDSASLAAWLSHPLPRALATDDLDQTDYHAYLFGRPGPPALLGPAIYPRWAMVGVCSGLSLGLGVVLLLLRPASRWLGLSALAAVLALVVLTEPNAFYQCVQSAALGFCLAIVAALLERLITRRRSVPPVFTEPSSVSLPAGAGSGFSSRSSLDVGSDESTIIRQRVPLPQESFSSAQGAVENGTT